MENPADVETQERLFLIAPVGFTRPQTKPGQPVNFRRWPRRSVHRLAEDLDNTGWTPDFYGPRDHAAALAAHAHRIRGGSTITTVSLEEL